MVLAVLCRRRAVSASRSLLRLRARESDTNRASGSQRVEPPKRQLMVCCPLSCSLLLDGASTRSAVQCASAHAGTCPCGTGRAGTSDTRMGTAGRAQRIDASEYAHKVRSILEKEYATHPSDQMNTLLAKAILADSAASMAPRRNIQAGSPLEGVIIFLCIMALGELPLRCSTCCALPTVVTRPSLSARPPAHPHRQESMRSSE
jgi:hypothetical protein